MMRFLSRSSKRQTRWLSLLLCVAFEALLVSARAEVHVSGEPDAVKVEVSDSSVQELLDTLSATYGLQYHSSANLSRSVAGKFSGPLPYVLWRVLQGYNFVVDTSASGITVAIYEFGAGHRNNFALARNIASPAALPQSPHTPIDQRHALGPGHRGPLFERKPKLPRGGHGAPSQD